MKNLLRRFPTLFIKSHPDLAIKVIVGVLLIAVHSKDCPTG